MNVNQMKIFMLKLNICVISRIFIKERFNEYLFFIIGRRNFIYTCMYVRTHIYVAIKKPYITDIH